MKVSVVVPAYNEEKRISRCLEALKNQTFRPYEIIVSDGGSTDRTVAIAKKYGRVVVAPRRGISLGRKLGGFAAKGDIICFTDADCLPSSQWLENAAASFKPGVVFVTGPIRPMTRSLALKAVYRVIFEVFVPFVFLIGKPMTAGWNICCTRAAFRRIGGFDEDVVTAEDLEFLSRLTKTGKSVYSPKAVVYTSTRREERYGVLHLAAFHLKNGLKFLLFKRSAEHYPDVR